MRLWKKLLTVVAGFSLTVSAANAQTPALKPPASQSSLEAEGFRGAVFATEQPGSGVVQAVAKKVTPVRDAEQAAQPAVDVFDPNAIQRPEDFVFGPSYGSPRWRAWAGAELLLGTGSSVNVVPIVTTGPASAGIPNAGAIGQPGTVPLFGGRKMLGDWRAGLRTEAGLWFDPAHNMGLTGRYYSLYSTSDQFIAVADGTSVVNVPQFVTVAGANTQIPAYVGFPGLTTGTIGTTAQTMFAGGDINLRHVIRQGRSWRVDALVGYRQLYLHDELGYEFTAVGAVVPPPATPFTSGADNLRTRNHFFGTNLGIQTSVVWKHWILEGVGAVALGTNVSELDFNQNRLATVAGVPQIPLLTTDISDPMTYFGTVAEGGVKLAYRVNTHFKLTVGYTGLFWWNIRRAQEQRTLSPDLTGATTHYYVHMLSCGAELRY